MTGKAVFGEPACSTRRRSRPRRSARIERLPDVAAAAGDVRARRSSSAPNGKVDLARRRHRARLQHRPELRALQPAHGSSPAAGRRARTRSRSTPRRPPPSTSRSATTSASSSTAGASSATRSPASPTTATRPRSAARRSRSSTCRRAQTLFGKQGELDQIDVAREAGRVGQRRCSPDQRRCCRRTPRCAPGSSRPRPRSTTSARALSTFRYFLLAFGGIALFVGAFVIANTLSITVAQRAREFATLRTMGATSRQVRGAVVLEGLVTGLVRLGGRALRRARARQGARGALQGRRRQTAADRARLRDPHGDRLARRRDGRHARREPLAGAARHARAADRRRARGLGAAAVAPRALRPRRRARRLRGRARARLRRRASSPALPTGTAPAPARRRGARASSSASRWSPRASPGRSRVVLGWPATRIGGVAGIARALERDAQPGPHRLDRRRADDRARARHAPSPCSDRGSSSRSSARSRASSAATTCSPPRTASRRPRSPRQNALRACRGRDASSPASAPARAAPSARRSSVAGLDPGLSQLLLLKWKHGANASMATLGTERRDRRQRLRERQPPHRRLADSASRRRRAARSQLKVDGDLHPARGREPARHGLDLLAHASTRSTRTPRTSSR